MRKMVFFLSIMSILIHCKRDKKLPVGPQGTTRSNKSVPSDVHAYSFVSNHEDLEKLYTSDAWKLVLSDMKEMGLVSLEVARLETTYFVKYHLGHIDHKMFKTRMEVLPSFKNFREMSKAITGTPMDYGSELECLFDLMLSKNDVQEATAYHRAILRLPILGNEEQHELLRTVFGNEEMVFQMTSYLKSLGVLDLAYYSNSGDFFMSITTPSGVVPETMELAWNRVLAPNLLKVLQEKHPALQGATSLIADWEQLHRLTSYFEH